MPRRHLLRFSAGRRRHHRDGSRNCSIGAVYKPGEACLAPTQIYRTHRTLECLVGTCCVSLRGVVGIIVTGRGIVPLELFTNRARHASPLHRFIEPTAPGMLRRRPLRSSAGRRRHHRDGSRNCSVGAVYKPGEECLAPTKIYRTHRTLECLVGTCCVFLRDVVGIIVTGRGIVPLELFTNRARHASPLHRFIEPTAPGMPRRRPLRFSAGRRRHHRDGSRNCSVGAVCKPGEACLAPTKIYRTHRTWDAWSASVAFLCGASSASS